MGSSGWLLRVAPGPVKPLYAQTAKYQFSSNSGWPLLSDPAIGIFSPPPFHLSAST